MTSCLEQSKDTTNVHLLEVFTRTSDPTPQIQGAQNRMKLHNGDFFT